MLQKPVRVLILDDDSDLRKSTAAYLEDSGFIPIEAQSGQEGLRLLLMESPDIALVDLRMPGMDGYEFLLHMSRNFPGIPAIAVSGTGILGDAVLALRQGAWDYVSKPLIDMNILVDIIKKCLEQAELLRERERYHEQLEHAVRERTHALEASCSNLRESQALVQEKSQFLNALLESIPNPIFYKNMDGLFLGSNRLFKKLVSPESQGADLAGKTLANIFPADVVQTLAVAERLLSPNKSDKVCEVEIPGVDGIYSQYAVYMSYFYSTTNSPIGVVSTFYDITDIRATEARILYQATHDELTGLLNRLGMRRHLDAFLNTHTKNACAAVLYLDLDKFQHVNDSLGHSHGDRLLRVIASRLSLLCGSKNLVSRPGGDEFIILMPCDNKEELILSMAGKIFNGIKEPVSLAGRELFVQASMGVAFCPEDGADANTLIQNAELAMYGAKKQGGGCLHRYTSTLGEQAVRRMERESLVRKALENKELILYFQPKVRLRDLRVVGVEALLRWNSPPAPHLPDFFIAVAEDSGLIIEIGKWILENACREMLLLMEETNIRLRVSVNISPCQLQPNFPQTVRKILEATQFPPSLLELEITESAMMQDVHFTINLLRELKESGVRIGIDDFGTGLSSLFYLKNFPVDTLKIDKAFVSDVAGDNVDATLVTAIVAMAKGLSLETVAEGIEREEQVAFLRTIGCTEAQGYYYSRPLSLEYLRNFLAGCSQTLAH